MQYSVLNDILILLAISVAAVAAFRRFNLPPILGYLFVGIVAGPHAFGWLEESKVTQLLGEIGVVFLLFTIGLEFSIAQFRAMMRTLLGLGGAQVLISTVSGGIIAWLLGIPWQAAFVVGGALAMSSTAIVVKQLTEQLELQSQHGRLSLGILLFQDIAAVPFLVMIPILAASTDQPIALPLAYVLLKGATAVIGMLILGRWALRPLFHHVAALHSRELFTFTVLLVALAAAWVTHAMGLSLALGAFIAGMMLAETEYRHQIDVEIRPFRDVLLALFFVTVGMVLDLAMLPPLWPWIVLLVLGLVFGKGIVIALLTRVVGYKTEVAVRTGTVLGHGGEFGIALLTVAVLTGLLSLDKSQPILAAIIISMALAPILIRYNGLVIDFSKARTGQREQASHEQEIAAAVKELRDHVIICGFGRVGQNVASLLREVGFEYVGLDLDPVRVKEAWEDGKQVYYGNAVHREILEAAGLSQARALVISIDDVRGGLKILHAARSLRKDLPILVRARDDANLDELLDAGATEVIPETLEASLTLATQLMLLLEVPRSEISNKINAVREDRYQLLRGAIIHEGIKGAGTTGREKEHMHSVILTAGAFAVGHRLEDLDLEDNGVLVTAVRRDGTRREAPRPELVLQSGDVLVLYGTHDALQHAKDRLLKGDK